MKLGKNNSVGYLILVWIINWKYYNVLVGIELR